MMSLSYKPFYLCRSSLLQQGRLVIVGIPDSQHQGHESKQQWGPHTSPPWSLEPWKHEPWRNTIAILCTGKIRLVARTKNMGCLWAENCWQTFGRFKTKKTAFASIWTAQVQTLQVQRVYKRRRCPRLEQRWLSGQRSTQSAGACLFETTLLTWRSDSKVSNAPIP